MRLISRFTFSFTLILCASTAFAQFETRGNTISVSGDAQINVVPDKVAITLGVETVNSTLDAAKSANDASCARILAMTQNFNIAAKDIQTDFISIEPRYDPHGSLAIVGYTVRKSMAITLRDVPRFDALLSAAVDNGANVVLNVQFLTSDLRKYRDQARVLAIKAAKEKADGLAGALGQRAGQALSINEQQSNWWSSYNSGWNRSGNNSLSQNVVQNASYAPSDGGSGETTAPGQTQVRATVQVVFQLTSGPTRAGN